MNGLAWFVILAGSVIAIPASMFVAWLVGRAVELADAHGDPTPREIELDAWIDDVLRSGR
ncbi:MAG TPA: hypothetical protein VIL68_02505 [Propionibacteriaceae bacterium]